MRVIRTVVGGGAFLVWLVCFILVVAKIVEHARKL